MAVTVIFDGTLDAAEVSEWIAVPQSSAYVVAGVTNSVDIQCSNDQAQWFALPAPGAAGALVSGVAAETSSSVSAFRVANVPVGYMRAVNKNIDTRSASISVAST